MFIVRIIKKFNSILSKHQKLRVIELAILMVIGGMLEMCSVSLVIPFMNAVLNSEAMMENRFVKMACGLFHIESASVFIMFLAVALAGIYIFKNLYLLLEFNVQYRFVYGNMLSMQKRLLNGYLRRPYEFYLKADSGEIIRIMNSDVPNAFSLLTVVLSFFTETTVSVILVATIFAITPSVTICMAVVLLLIMFPVNAIIKPVLSRAGKISQSSSAKMNKWLIQGIQGIKEIRVMQKEDYFLNHYAENGDAYVRSLRRNQILGIVPRFFIEACSMSTMFLVIAVLIYHGNALDSVIPMLVAVAAAAVRLLPSVNRMSSALASMAYLEPMLDRLIDNISDMETELPISPKNRDEARELMKMDGVSSGLRLKDKLEVRNITYHYPDAEKNVLSSASMTIHKGQSVGIVGSSGAGKTTAVDIILGLLKVSGGQIIIDGQDISENMSAWRGMTGYIPQNIFLLDGTIKSNVAFGLEEKDIDERLVWQALKDASLGGFIQELPDGLETEIGERGIRLSGGQRQRIGIARALYRNPEVLIFDEATSALDNETEMAIMESIQSLQGHKTMIIIAHRLTTIDNCDCVYRVENGEIKRER